MNIVNYVIISEIEFDKSSYLTYNKNEWLIFEIFLIGHSKSYYLKGSFELFRKLKEKKLRH